MHSHGIPMILDSLGFDAGVSPTLALSPNGISLYPEKRQTTEQPSNFAQGLANPPDAICTGGVHERIPSEIWAEIFAIVVEGLPIHFPPDFSRPQWVLSRISSRWRSIAFEESRLWNSIEVTSTSISSAVRTVAFTNRMIFPSGPLLISVNDHGGCPSFSTEVVERLVIPHLPRTRALTLNLKSDGYSRFFRVSPELFNSIEVLDLKFGFSVVNESILHASQTTTIFHQAQELRKLKFVGCFEQSTNRLSTNVVATPIPWHQLTELDLRLSSLDLATVHWLLCQCTRLQAFNANVQNNPTSYALAIDLVLPHLQSLNLWLDGPHILNNLIVPTLTELHVSALWNLPTIYVAIANMLSRSQCSLSVFVANARVGPDTPSMKVFMELMPAALIFRGHGLLVDNITLEMIGHGQLLPSLTTLLCDVYSPSAFLGALTLRLGQVKEGVT